METNGPKDDQVTNDDNAVTNKDGDNNLEQGEQPNVQDNPDPVRVPTVTPGNEGDPTPSKKSEGTSDIGDAPIDESL